jgi:hypothetical protein
VLDSCISKLKNYRKKLAEQGEKINMNKLNILKVEDISNMIDIMKNGLTKYEQVEMQINKMIGPEAKIPLEQGPNDTESESKWKEQILRTIKTHWETLFSETRENNCKSNKVECIGLTAEDKTTRAIAMNNLIDYHNAFVLGFIKRHYTRGITVHLHETDELTYPNYTVDRFSINIYHTHPMLPAIGPLIMMIMTKVFKKTHRNGELKKRHRDNFENYHGFYEFLKQSKQNTKNHNIKYVDLATSSKQN